MRIFKLLVVLCTTGILLSCDHFAITEFVAPSNAFGDTPIEVSCVVKNDNQLGESGRDRIKFYLSIDRYFEDSDFFLGGHFTANLEPGQIFTLSQTLQLPAFPAGKYFLIATNETGSPFDGGEEVYFREIELKGTNNGSDLVPMNLFLKRFHAVSPDDIFNFHYTVFNNGNSRAKQTEAHYYLSEDLKLDKETDVFIGGAVIPALDGKEKLEIIGNTYIPGYEFLDSFPIPYLIIELDAIEEKQELLETNNCIAQQIFIKIKQEEEEGNIVGPKSNRLVQENNESLDIPVELMLHPNPTTAFINLSLNLREKEDVLITIYSMNGQRLKTLTTTQVIGNYSKQIDLSDLPAAPYMVNVTVGNQSFSRKVILK